MTAPRNSMQITPEPIPFTPEGPQPLVREVAPGAAFPVQHLGPLRGRCRGRSRHGTGPNGNSGCISIGRGLACRARVC